MSATTRIVIVGTGGTIASRYDPAQGRTVASQEVRVCGDGDPVVVTSRCPSGRVMPIYGGGGGGRDLQDAGVIFSGNLKGPKARLLLMAALADPETRPKLRDLFRAIAP